MKIEIEVRMRSKIINRHFQNAAQCNLVASVCVLRCKRSVRQHEEEVAILLSPIGVPNSYPWIRLPHIVDLFKYGCVVDLPARFEFRLSSPGPQYSRYIPVLDAQCSDFFPKLEK